MSFEKQTEGIGDQFKHTKKVPGLQEVSATADQIEKLISELQLDGKTGRVAKNQTRAAADGGRVRPFTDRRRAIESV